MIQASAFAALVQRAHHERPGLPLWLASRAIAACYLSYCCGLWFPEIAALQPADWLPGDDVVRVRGDRTERRRASQVTRPRMIPVCPAAKKAVEDYRRFSPVSAESLFLFDEDDGDRGRTLKGQVTLALKRCGLDKVNAGELRKSFETFVRSADAGDGLVDYLIGATPKHHVADRWVGRRPPTGLMRSTLKAALPVWTSGSIAALARAQAPA